MATPSLAAGAFGAVAIKAAYDKYFELALRHAPVLRDIADKRPVDVDKPSSTVTFHIHADLPVATGTLTDGTDVAGVALPAPSPITITLGEYGNAVTETKLLRIYSMTDVDPFAANTLAYNMRDSLDAVFQTELRGGTNVRYANGVAGPTNTLTVASVITSKDVRYIVTKLRGNAAVPKVGELYGAYIHPDVAFDLKSETGAANWRDPHNYTAPDNIWRHVLGVYEGAYFIETARMARLQDGASGTQANSVYRTIFCGQQAVAEAVAIEGQMVVNGNPGADALRRLYVLGWYAVLGWKRFREPALYRLETGSSVSV